MFFFFFKQKTAYERRISDWSSDVCSSDLFATDTNVVRAVGEIGGPLVYLGREQIDLSLGCVSSVAGHAPLCVDPDERIHFAVEVHLASSPRSTRNAVERSEEHTSELQSLMRISNAVFCLTNKHTLNICKHPPTQSNTF